MACPAGTRTLVVDTGDLGDEVVLAANLRAHLFGGSGNDVLNTANSAVGAVMDGGDHSDSLLGGSGGDTMIGGEGDDLL